MTVTESTPLTAHTVRGTTHGARPALASIGLPGSDVPRAPLSSEAWAAVLDEATRERLTGLLQWAVWTGRLPATDAQVGEVFDRHLPVAAHVVRLEQELAAASSALTDDGIAHRVLKGPAVAHLDYPDPGMRAFTDVDLLVGAKDMAAALRALGYIGYQRPLPALRERYDHRFATSVSMVSPGGLEVEIHRSLIGGPAALRMDLTNVWRRAQSLSIAGKEVEALTKEQRLVHASMVLAACTQPPRRVRLRDVAQMLVDPGIDPDAVLVTANRWGVRPLLALAVAQTCSVLGLSDEAVGWWARTTGRQPTDPEPLDDDWARWLPLYQGSSDARRPLATETIRELSPSQRVAFVATVVVPQRRYLRSRGIGRLEYVRSGFSRWFFRP